MPERIPAEEFKKIMLLLRQMDSGKDHLLFKSLVNACLNPQENLIQSYKHIIANYFYNNASFSMNNYFDATAERSISANLRRLVLRANHQIAILNELKQYFLLLIKFPEPLAKKYAEFFTVLDDFKTDKPMIYASLIKKCNDASYVLFPAHEAELSQVLKFDYHGGIIQLWVGGGPSPELIRLVQAVDKFTFKQSYEETKAALLDSNSPKLVRQDSGSLKRGSSEVHLSLKRPMLQKPMIDRSVSYHTEKESVYRWGGSLLGIFPPQQKQNESTTPDTSPRLTELDPGSSVKL